MSDKKIISDRLDKIADYIEEIIGKYDFDKSFSLNPSMGNSMMDNLVSIERYKYYLKNNEFCTFNHLTYISMKYDDKILKSSDQAYPNGFIINEIYTLKLALSRILYKFGNIISDLVDCKNIKDKIVMEGLNGYMIIENDELILYLVYRFIAREGNHMLYSEVNLSTNQNNKDSDGKKNESLKVIKVKQYDPKFAPLYYRRFFFKLNKDAKTFNFSIYFAMINTLYSLKLYYPCITLLSLFIEEMSLVSMDLYEKAKSSKKIMCYLHLYEFALFIQVYILIVLNNFDRALYELMRISNPINEYNTLLFKILLGLGLAQCSYYDLAIYTLAEAAQMIKPLIDATRADEEMEKKKELLKPEELKNDKLKKRTQEGNL